MRDLRLPYLRSWSLRPSGMSCEVVDSYRSFGKTYRPNFFLDCLIVEDETDTFSRNVSNLCHIKSQKSTDLDEHQFTCFVPAAQPRSLKAIRHQAVGAYRRMAVKLHTFLRSNFSTWREVPESESRWTDDKRRQYCCGVILNYVTRYMWECR